MIFSTRTIQSINNRKLNETVNEEYKEPFFFNEYLDISLQESLENKSMILDVYNEGFIFNTFSKIVDTIINKFRDWAIKAYNKVIDFLINTTQKSRVIYFLKDKIKDIDTKVYYDKKYNKYRNLDISPVPSMKRIVKTLFEDLQNTVKEINKSKTADDIVDKLSSIISSPDNDYYDSIRGDIIGVSKSVSKEDYVDEILDFYIEKSSKMEYIPADEVKEVYNAYSNYKMEQKKIEKEKSDINTLCKNIKDKVNGIKIEKKPIITSNSEISKAYDKVIKDQCEIIKELTSIFGLFFATKLDMMKEKRKQDKDILVAACKTIAKKGDKK